ncbi:transferase family III protein [Rutstroemia sp. NJR-2017a WRK4]|nr:transferase family III protein [Rutstroemia sp. NJR-2017a WRK4]
MPAISLTRAILNSTTTTNHTAPVLHVVCAFPVSGQYGPGSRVLYYVLIAACVFARKAEWLRNACLAAALLFPAVAALHGIVLAAVHVDGAVDMDIFGAFQLCSIGILAAPVTVKLSKTYFETPGRNTIFLWTGLILAGLLSLAVEFFRVTTTPCPFDNQGNPISPRAGDFNYTNTCGLVCSTDEGPFSPLRGGSANNIYVIPAPDADKLTFDTVVLLAAACCIPAILSLVSMWMKILEINWKSRFGNNEDEPIDQTISGTNNATVGKMNEVNSLLRTFLSAVEVPVFGAAVLAIVIMGERNFFSSQVRYQTEPIESIGQWAPIVGTGLAVFGSLYILISVDLDALNEEKPSVAKHHCDCPVHGDGAISIHSSRPEATHIERSPSTSSREAPHEIERTLTRPDQAKHRRAIARVLTTVGNYVGNAAQARFDDSEFKKGKAVDFPEIPGEHYRNLKLPQIREIYNGNVTPALRPSRAPSFAGSITSIPDLERSFRAGEGLNIVHAVAPSASLSPPPASPTGGEMLERSRPRGNTLETP